MGVVDTASPVGREGDTYGIGETTGIQEVPLSFLLSREMVVLLHTCPKDKIKKVVHLTAFLCINNRHSRNSSFISPVSRDGSTITYFSHR